MPYIGKSPVGGGFHKLDALTASATDTYSLTLGGASYFPETANQLLVSLNGVIQACQDSFQVSGSNLIFDSALTASDSIDLLWLLVMCWVWVRLLTVLLLLPRLVMVL